MELLLKSLLKEESLFSKDSQKINRLKDKLKISEKINKKISNINKLKAQSLNKALLISRFQSKKLKNYEILDSIKEKTIKRRHSYTTRQKTSHRSKEIMMKIFKNLKNNYKSKNTTARS